MSVFQLIHDWIVAELMEKNPPLYQHQGLGRAVLPQAHADRIYGTMTMMGPQMSSGENFMRAQRDAQALQNAALYQHGLANLANLGSLGGYNPHNQSSQGAPTPEEKPAEDVTGLRMLEEFLQRRQKGEK